MSDRDQRAPGSETFVSRWSKRKQQARQDGLPADRPAEAPSQASDVAANQGGEPADAAQQALIDSLPDPETLKRGDDFRQFMQAGVPRALRNAALRKLWRSDPVFACLDGLNDYDEDYTDKAMVHKGLQTVYRVGKGLLTDEEITANSLRYGPKALPAEPSSAAEHIASEPDAQADDDRLADSPADDAETARDTVSVAAPVEKPESTG